MFGKQSPQNQTLSHHEPLGKVYVYSVDLVTFTGAGTNTIVVGGVTYSAATNVKVPADGRDINGTVLLPPGKYAQNAAMSFASAINADVNTYGTFHTRDVPNGSCYARVSGTRIIFFGRVPGDAFLPVVTIATAGVSVTTDQTGSSASSIVVEQGLTVVTAWGTGSLATNATGTTYNTLASVAAKEVTLTNNAGTTLDIGLAPTPAAPYKLLDGQAITIPVVANANEIAVRRSDTSNTPVTVTYLYANSN